MLEGKCPWNWSAVFWGAEADCKQPITEVMHNDNNLQITPLLCDVFFHQGLTTFWHHASWAGDVSVVITTPTVLHAEMRIGTQATVMIKLLNLAGFLSQSAHTDTPCIPYPAGTIPNHYSDIPKHTWGVLHEGRVVQAALQVTGSHQRSVTQVAPQQASLQLPLAHDLLPGPHSSGALAAQSHDVDGPASQTTGGWKWREASHRQMWSNWRGDTSICTGSYC